MIKLVIFDWNGTIIADTEAVREADNYLIKKFGGKKPTYQEYVATECNSSIEFYVRYGCKNKELKSNLKLAGQLQNEFYEKRAANIRTRKGTKELLTWLSKKKISSIILSNHIEKSIHYHLKRLQLNQYFSHVFAHNLQDGFLRPHNKIKKMKYFLLTNQLDSKEVVVIGDSPEEIRAGKELGAVTIALTNGCHSVNKLKKVNPDKIASNLKECIDIIKKI
ncbi:hypothetical protein COY27_05710 [Candidatus Woesearchaeota archaeon CG_4_10_14_0_2_um_filter_33_13]|nr:MAG: hypothetical protein COY27_05710 [Candidatus Woesearchaeota archaeon CG_4_10_14_0_2_um_filter_33_13]